VHSCGHVAVGNWHRRDNGWFSSKIRSRRARVRLPDLEVVSTLKISAMTWPGTRSSRRPPTAPRTDATAKHPSERCSDRRRSRSDAALLIRVSLDPPIRSGTPMRPQQEVFEASCAYDDGIRTPRRIAPKQSVTRDEAVGFARPS
jgi:hypothetical protein